MLIRRWLPYPSWKDLDDKNDQLFTIRYEAAVTPSRTPPGQAFLTLAFPNEEAIILRDVSNGRGTMNPVTTFCPGWWLKANDPPPSFLPFALVLPFRSPCCLWTCLLPFFFLSSDPSLIRGGKGVWFSMGSICIFRFLNRRKWSKLFWNLGEINKNRVCKICKVENLLKVLLNGMFNKRHVSKF